MDKEKSHSYQDMANLTHETQVKEFNFCLCEEQEQFPYEDCPKENQSMEDNISYLFDLAETKNKLIREFNSMKEEEE
jgi:hypothetical protein